MMFYCKLEEMKISNQTKKGFFVESLQGEYPLNAAMESENLLIIKNQKRSWIDHILCDLPCPKWIIYSISFNVHSNTETEVLLLLL